MESPPQKQKRRRRHHGVGGVGGFSSVLLSRERIAVFVVMLCKRPWSFSVLDWNPPNRVGRWKMTAQKPSRQQLSIAKSERERESIVASTKEHTITPRRKKPGLFIGTKPEFCMSWKCWKKYFFFGLWKCKISRSSLWWSFIFFESLW